MEWNSERSPLSTGIVGVIDVNREQLMTYICLSEVNQRHTPNRQPSSGWSTRRKPWHRQRFLPTSHGQVQYEATAAANDGSVLPPSPTFIQPDPKEFEFASLGRTQADPSLPVAAIYVWTGVAAAPAPTSGFPAG